MFFMPCVIATDKITNLTSSDSFDGSSSVSGGKSEDKAFTAKQTSEASGTTYHLNDNVTIQNVSSITPSGKSCFDNSMGSLTFIGGARYFIFQALNLSSPPEGAAIKNTNTALSFSNFSALVFKNASGRKSKAQGAVFVTNTAGGKVTFTTNADIIFDSNHSTKEGGAVSAHTIDLTKTSRISLLKNSSNQNGGALAAADKINFQNVVRIIFDSNTAKEKGGALYSKSGEITFTSNILNNNTVGNEYTTTIKANKAKTGGALYVEENCSITKSGPIQFAKNKATSTTTTPTDHEGCGGAICCFIPTTKLTSKTGLTISDNQRLSFDGNTATENGGGIYATKGVLSKSPFTEFIGNTAKRGGALYAENDFSITNNVLFFFGSNQAKVTSTSPTDHEGCGGAIYNITTDPASTGLTITENRTLNFTGNVAMASGGAIYATQCTLSNHASLTFFTNLSTEKGGAICTTKGTLSNNPYVEFMFNNAKRGGALYAENTLSITNSEYIFLKGNQAKITSASPTDHEGCGGGIHNIPTDPASTGLTMTGHTILNFTNNNAFFRGGAIYATKCTLSDNASLTFFQNSSAESGGAIYAKILHLTSGGPTLFTKNQIGTGGVIEISADGELELVAAKGDITFLDNETGKVIGIPKTYIKMGHANSIHLGTGAKISKLDARKGYSIYFYDPITTEPPKSGAVVEPLKINALKVTPSTISSGEKPTPAALKMSISKETSSGTLVFSGEKLTPKEAALPVNTTSTIHQDISFESGNLVLKSDAVLAVRSFIQQPDSMLFMDTGTSLETTTKSNAKGDITVTNLSVNLKSLSDKKLAKIAVKSPNGKLKLSGDLILYSHRYDYYENPILNKDLCVPLLELSALSGDVNTRNFNSLIPEELNTTTYGYQGTWSLISKKLPDSTMTLSLLWKATGYKPTLERRASLVPNSLWTAAIDLHSIQDALTTHMHNVSAYQNLWVIGISNFFHKNRTASNAGFRHISGGYIIGGSMLTPSDTAFAIAIGQLFGKAKDYVVSNIKSRIYTGSLYGQHQGSLRLHSSLRRYAPSKILLKIPEELPLVLNAQVTYARNRNNMTTKYTVPPPGISSWNNQGFAAELGSFLPIDIKDSYFTSSTPFLKLQLVYANQKSCEEKATTARGFSSSHLVNLSMPLGATFTQRSPSSRHAIQGTLSYILDIYRIQPQCLTSLLISGVSWMTWATNLERHAGKIQIASHHSPLPNFNFSMQGSFEIRASSRNYNANCNGNYSF
ncbi:polymorphic membrane protein G family [Candidatus Chlamydia sanziniae]|uniref:Polymorphic membrane protein G family n=2 Tax=Candidatus Chlamydia sanziniae TaxID=1806891 RepID=A0A1A9HV09_9CHLA|nr:polymorphic membrane protein G family [Candidatus Chlamydia sanziniae]